MVSTKHCCWGECRSDPRYPEKLHKALKEMVADGKKAFIPFPKPSQGKEKCQRWINACSREKFTLENITRNTYICALHWPGEKGPTPEHPDPLKANLTPKQIAKSSAPKRKAPFRPKAGVLPSKKKKDIHQDAAAETGETFSELGVLKGISNICCLLTHFIQTKNLQSSTNAQVQEGLYQMSVLKLSIANTCFLLKLIQWY